MAKMSLNILLILDNCSAHLVNVCPNNIWVEFLPPNCTSILQPLDLGIMKNVKVHFRQRLLQRILINLRMQKPDPINVRQAAQMLTGAWWTVTPITIANCWCKAGLDPANWTTVGIPTMKRSYMTPRKTKLNLMCGTNCQEDLA